jgi:hypothetical protein
MRRILSTAMTDPSLNNDNFRAISRLLLRRGHNELKHHCENANKNGAMMSGRIQNEIIENSKMVLRELLVELVDNAGR